MGGADNYIIPVTKWSRVRNRESQSDSSSNGESSWQSHPVQQQQQQQTALRSQESHRDPWQKESEKEIPLFVKHLAITSTRQIVLALTSCIANYF